MQNQQRINHAQQNAHAVIVNHTHTRQTIVPTMGTNLGANHQPTISATHVTNPLQRKVG